MKLLIKQNKGCYNKEEDSTAFWDVTTHRLEGFECRGGGTKWKKKINKSVTERLKSV